MFDRFRNLLRRNQDYRQVFGTPEGKRVLADLYRFCHVGQPVHVPNDPATSAFNDGMRRVALRIASVLGMDDEELLKLAREQEDIEHDQQGYY